MVGAGRLTTYTDEMLGIAQDYVDNFIASSEEMIPTVVGLCRKIKRSKSTVYSWKKDADKRQFLDILEEIDEKQHIALISGGLSGSFNSAITKMMLTKHGYSDKAEIDHTTNGKDIAPAFGFVDVGDMDKED